MKIAKIETTVVGTPWRELTFVELITDDGRRGVGEARMLNHTDTLVAAIGELGQRYVIGTDPFDVEKLAWRLDWEEYARAGEVTQTVLGCFDPGLLRPHGAGAGRTGMATARRCGPLPGPGLRQRLVPG